MLLTTFHQGKISIVLLSYFPIVLCSTNRQRKILSYSPLKNSIVLYRTLPDFNRFTIRISHRATFQKTFAGTFQRIATIELPELSVYLVSVFITRHKFIVVTTIRRTLSFVMLKRFLSVEILKRNRTDINLSRVLENISYEIFILIR